MPTSLQHRREFTSKLTKLVGDMSAWEEKERIDADELVRIRSSIRQFQHRSTFVGGIPDRRS
jgi:hypothetical protein